MFRSIRSMRRRWVDNEEAMLEDLTIKRSAYWTYRDDVGKAPRRKVNGLKSCDAVSMARKEEESQASLWQFMITVLVYDRQKLSFFTEIGGPNTEPSRVGAFEQGV